MVNVYLISKMAKVTILQLVTKQSILIFIQTFILIFGLNFSMKVLFLSLYAIVCTNLLTFLESVTKLVLYSGWKRFQIQKLTGGD
ncbi:TPA: hypothetical protein O1U84_000100 [Staphylococcus aureus]|uniref:hypothetical protein n=2 Tax=Staphylococcus aureus TaxID=1280 RepID=UPI0009934F04|nr:hypothetical protein [Staphylococcus aureus]MCG5197875.1 hypothetical protein [Staphylococcus aureus]WIZ29668.1 hypothetical protein PCM76_07825 [Staphylococcus aureus]HCG2310627.1 hypothetical protein [Staphylococcus aureus]HCG2370065.1 hypothetical protein [Staphylococcus aureus]HCV1240446.1 hypothetical protein [Staphylococcus aureus]